MFLNETYNELGASATDNTDGTVQVVISGIVDTSRPGDYTITYKASDSVGNTSSVNRTITVTLPPDTTSPVITLNGDSSITMFLNETYNELGASATDNTDGTVQVVISGTVDISTLGNYIVIYTGTDSAGNTSSVIRTIIVVEPPDISAPIITLNGDSEISLLLNYNYSELGATAIDERDGALDVVISGTIDVTTLGNYIVSYTATDSAGNTSSVTRTIIVIEPPDISAPIITLNGDSEISLLLNDNYSELGATAIDERDGALDVVISGTIDVTTLGNYIVSYTATDSAGNTSSVTRTIIVIEPPDISAPIITLNGDSEISLLLNDNYSELGATAIDERDGALDVVISGTIDVTTLGNYTLTYTAIDNAGNTSNTTRIISIISNIAPRPFITIWNTSPSDWRDRYVTDDNQIMISTEGDGYDYQVDWGDGTFDEHVTGNITHTYSVTGIYTVAITGDFPQIFFEKLWSYDPNDNSLYPDPTTDNVKLLAIEQWGDIKWRSMKQAFMDCYNFTYNATDIPDLSIVNDMSSMFYGNVLSGGATFHQSLSDWDVSHVRNMHRMFWGADSFDQILSNWDVSHVTDMSSMFYGADSFDQDLSGWNVSQVTDMSSMFSQTDRFNQSLSNWNVSNVTNMSSMFASTVSFNQDLSGWSVSNVTNMSGMFASTVSFNQDLSTWDVSNVTNMSSMFASTVSFNQDLSDWDVSNVRSMGWMFASTASFEPDISDWDVSNVTDMTSMFYRNDSFNQDLSGWDVSSVTNMRYMFASTVIFNQDLSGWDVSNVTDMRSMFLLAASFNQSLSGWNVSNVSNMGGMFQEATSFNQNLNDWDISHVTYMGGMFQEATSFNQNLSSWDVSHVTNMDQMFKGAKAFDQNLSNWDVSNVTSMKSMLEDATLSTVNYDALFFGWSSLPLKHNVTFHGGSSQYSPSSRSARDVFTNNYNWQISDGGVAN